MMSVNHRMTHGNQLPVNGVESSNAMFTNAQRHPDRDAPDHQRGSPGLDPGYGNEGQTDHSLHLEILSEGAAG
jgi:hypothetical protein